MSILDAFKQDCQENGNSSCYKAELQAEVDKQMKAMADYNANPAVLDSQIKFNEEEIPFDERAIAKQLYIEEDGQYPTEADDPEELLNMTLADKSDTNSSDEKLIDVSGTYLEPCECNEVKLGDKLKIYNKKTKTFDVVEVSMVSKCYNPFTFEPVVCVCVNYDYEGAPESVYHGERKLSDPNVYYKVGSNEPITEFTFKDENQGK